MAEFSLPSPVTPALSLYFCRYPPAKRPSEQLLSASCQPSQRPHEPQPTIHILPRPHAFPEPSVTDDVSDVQVCHAQLYPAIPQCHQDHRHLRRRAAARSAPATPTPTTAGLWTRYEEAKLPGEATVGLSSSCPCGHAGFYKLLQSWGWCKLWGPVPVATITS